MPSPHYTLKRHEPTRHDDTNTDRDNLAEELRRSERVLRELSVDERRGTTWSSLLTVEVISPSERATIDDGADASSPIDELVDDLWRTLDEQVAMEGPTRFRVKGWSQPRGRRPLFEVAFVLGTPTTGEARRDSEIATSSMLASQSAVVEKLARMLERSYAGRELACQSRELATSKLGALVEQVLDAVGKAAAGIFAGAASDLHKLALEAEVKAEDNRHAEAQAEAAANDEFLMEAMRMFAEGMARKDAAAKSAAGGTADAGATTTTPPPSSPSPSGEARTRTKLCREARDMGRVLETVAKLSEDDQAKVRDALGDDGWSLVCEAAHAPDVQTFDALFGRFYAGLGAQGKEAAAATMATVMPLLRFDGLILMRLAQGFESRHGGA